MMRRFAVVGVVLVVLGPAREALAEDGFLLSGGETVVFFGDSITQAGHYVNYFEAYLLTRFPEKRFRVLNHGISSETISGTSEPDHHPRRPWAHERFTRDVTAWKPDAVVACFGMNDGNYHPFEPTRFRKYREGIKRLIRRTEDEAEARLILMTPPPFDPYRRRASDPDAIHFGYKFPAIDYDETLRKYSEWLTGLREEGRTVVDLHSAISAHLRKRRRKKVSFYLSPDAVHPNATGHWLMTQNLLLELDAPALADEAAVNAAERKVGRKRNPASSRSRVSDAERKVEAGHVSNFQRQGDVISFTWRSRLPMPMDSEWDPQSTRTEQVTDRLNRYRLRVAGLKAKRYEVTVHSGNGGDEPTVRWPVSATDLADGLDLLQFPDWPTVRASQRLLDMVKERRRLRYRSWRREIGQPVGRQTADPEAASETARRIEVLSAEIDRLRQPKTLHIRIVPQSANDES